MQMHYWEKNMQGVLQESTKVPVPIIKYLHMVSCIPIGHYRTKPLCEDLLLHKNVFPNRFFQGQYKQCYIKYIKALGSFYKQHFLCSKSVTHEALQMGRQPSFLVEPTQMLRGLKSYSQPLPLTHKAYNCLPAAPKLVHST